MTPAEVKRGALLIEAIEEIDDYIDRIASEGEGEEHNRRPFSEFGYVRVGVAVVTNVAPGQDERQVGCWESGGRIDRHHFIAGLRAMRQLHVKELELLGVDYCATAVSDA